MSINFTCCELIQALKDWLNNPKSKWIDEDKYFASEIFNKVGFEFWKDCENCRAYFKDQAKKQLAIFEKQIQKEKAEGKYYGPRNPKTYKGTIIEDAVKKLKAKEEANEKTQKPSLVFGKSPQE